jgi:hypothetical protein
MTSGTRVKAARREPVPLVEDPTEPEAPRLAEAADLGPATEWVDLLTLPIRNAGVFVRAVDSIQFAQVVELPDLFGYEQLLRKIRTARLAAEGKKEGEETPEPEPIDGRDFVREQLRFFAHIAHAAIVSQDAVTSDGQGHYELIGKEEPCDDPLCGVAHPRALWTVTQVRRLHPVDLEEVANFALRGRLGQRVGPFSGPPADSDTPQPVSGGESTPEQTSSETEHPST